tara:strand:- start:2441 stop:2797 length:357 start_codon:yes stop_codon:yes gene_type:complete
MHHILLECTPKNIKLLTDPLEGEYFIKMWININNLTPVKGVVVYEFENNIVDDNKPAGYSLLQCLMESHMSIHTYPEYDKIHMDIFSCGKLDKELNERFFNEHFEKHDYKFIDRNFTI